MFYLCSIHKQTDFQWRPNISQVQPFITLVIHLSKLLSTKLRHQSSTHARPDDPLMSLSLRDSKFEINFVNSLKLKGSIQAAVYGGLCLARDQWVYRLFSAVPGTQVLKNYYVHLIPKPVESTESSCAHKICLLIFRSR